jgi:hypothetical protein
VYALTSTQDAAAKDRLARQTTGVGDDFFAGPPGKSASRAVGLPFGD